MTKQAAELWLQDLTDAAEVDGDLVHAAVTVDLDIDSVVTISRRRVSEARPQGIALDADEPFTIGDTSATAAVLWSDTSPDTVECRAAAGRLTIWNVWRVDGAVHAWTGGAGIRRVELGDHDTDFGIRLLAHDGLATDDEPDLEFEVRIDGTRHRATDHT